MTIPRVAVQVAFSDADALQTCHELTLMLRRAARLTPEQRIRPEMWRGNDPETLGRLRSVMADMATTVELPGGAPVAAEMDRVIAEVGSMLAGRPERWLILLFLPEPSDDR